PMPPPPPTPTWRSGISAQWLGQDGSRVFGPGDVHVVVAGLPTGRTITAATLSDQVTGSWVFRQDPWDGSYYADPYAMPLAAMTSTDPTQADLAFPPYIDESGATMTLRLRLDDSSTYVIQFPGGRVDLGLLAPDIAPTSIVAHPGDDLNDLANRFGTVYLAAGTYDLNRPLVLNHPVTIQAAPGALLRFSQAADDAPWTAAIKINAGHTTLDGFAVRFAGPVRWNGNTSYGPAVIGSTDNLDPGPTGLKVEIRLKDLDLESPPVPSGWEEAPRLIRLVTAMSGQIEGCTLKGGTTEYAYGPWQIQGNTYLGTVPNTYAGAVFAGHWSRDVVLAHNTAQPTGPSGKTWRFLALNNGGHDDLIRDNTIIGIGPRDDDSMPNPNATEIILNESYGLHFEGMPLTVSPDGRLLQIPAPPGGPAQSGDIVAILSGPQAGQWRRIAQALDPQTYLMDAPLPPGRYAIAISSNAFVTETYQDNTIDMRGSSIATGLVLAGNQFGVQVLGNHFLGAGAFLLMAYPTETPNLWGWSHAPFLGASIEGNTIDDAPWGGKVSVPHGPLIKTNQGRVYFSGSITNTTIRWSDAFLAAHPEPTALTIGDPGSIDPIELVVTIQGDRVQGPPGLPLSQALIINAGTVNDQPRLGQALALPALVPEAPTGLGLVRDTGSSASDGLTADGRLHFQLVAGAVGYEYRVGSTGDYQPIPSPNGFLPLGLVEGLNRVFVRSIDARGARSADASFTFVLDTTPPPAITGLAASADETITFASTGPGDVYAYRLGPSGAFLPLGAATTFTPMGLKPGPNTVTLLAIDIAGNIGPEATIIVARPLLLPPA
ncbi:MAG: hypothetical protein IRY99_20430, partial [Isosphaeraceae bacterium]|nr:hypothetical protein [Isosphaeraceae bacterium]